MKVGKDRNGILHAVPSHSSSRATTQAAPAYEGSNFQQLLNGTAPFPIVYRNNDSIIYGIQK